LAEIGGLIQSVVFILALLAFNFLERQYYFSLLGDLYELPSEQELKKFSTKQYETMKSKEKGGSAAPSPVKDIKPSFADFDKSPAKNENKTEENKDN